jgi:DMSO/TMAO reductase YedYZ molybdopterin-dependent catalytic subunit
MPEPPEKADRVVEARLKLMARFKSKVHTAPSLADPRPLGTGAPNRHGMPKLPVGQTETKGWPVLDLGAKPKIPLDRWELRVDGAVASPLALAWKDFQELEQVRDVSDFHCVTAWSKLDLEWVGVRVSTVVALAEPLAEASHVLFHAHDGYTTNLPLEEALEDDVLLVHTVNGAPLPAEHGGPVRVVTPQLYAWKGAKWVKRLEILTADRRGFWEERGYSNTARPWLNDRYA